MSALLVFPDASPIRLHGALMFLVEHRHHEMLAVDVAEVLAKDHVRLPGTADLGLRVWQTALAYQHDAVDRNTVRSRWSRFGGGKETLLLYGR